MNLTKANLVLAAAAVVLAIPTWITLSRDRETFVDIEDVPHMFEGFTPDRVASVVLGQPKEEQKPVEDTGGADAQKPKVEYDLMRLQRVDDNFVLGQGMGDLTGAPVNSQMIEAHVWKHLGEIREDQETLVQPGATDEQLEEFGLDEAHAFVVKAGNAQGQVLAELLVGKDSYSAGEGGVRGVFVRRGSSRDVVLYEVPYWNRAIKADMWIDRTVLRVQNETIRRVTLRNESGEVVFERPADSKTWTSPQPPEGRGACRQVEVEGLVQRFSFMQANKLIRPLQGADLKAMGLVEPTIEATVTYDKDGTEESVTLSIGSLIEGQNEHYLRSSKSNFVMGLGVHFVTVLERPVAEFFDPSGEGVDPTPADKDGDKEGNEDGTPQAVEPPKDVEPGTPGGATKPGDGGKPDDGKKSGGG